MAKILHAPLPIIPDQYDPQTMQLILSILETSLDDVNIPDEISGEDDVAAASWFLS